MNPKINIQYNRFLDPIFIEWIRSMPKYKNWPVPSHVEVLNKVSLFKREWSAVENKILNGLRKITGLNFRRNQIDVHVVSGNPRSFSFPIVVKSGYSSREFIQVVSHELIHCLFKDNEIFKRVKDPYPDNPHVLVHAILKCLYVNILKDEKLLEENIKRSVNTDNPEYKQAWNIVENKYEGITALFRDSVRSNQDCG